MFIDFTFLFNSPKKFSQLCSFLTGRTQLRTLLDYAKYFEDMDFQFVHAMDY